MTDELVRVERPDPPAEIGVSIIKGALGAVPVVGQALLEVLFDCRSRIKQERINNYFQDIANELRSQSDLKIDLEYLKTEEFSDLVEDILLRVACNRSQAKREHLKRVLLKAMQGHRAPDMAKTYLNILDEITDEELVLLAQFYKAHRGQPSLFNGPARLGHFQKSDFDELGYEYEHFLLMVQSLVYKGLLNDETMGRYDSDSQKTIRITVLGVSFYEYLSCQ